MGNYFDFRSKQGDQVIVNIHPKADFREVLQTLESIRFPEFVRNVENIKYAVLELISNSLRAHREKQVDRQIMAVFRATDTKIEVEVKDFGGGFDPDQDKLHLQVFCGAILITPMLFQKAAIESGTP